MSRQFRSDDTDKWKYGFGDGSDGDLIISSNTTKSANDYAGCSGTSGNTALTIDAAGNFSNGNLVLIHQTRGTGAGNWELNKIASGGGTTSLVLAHPLQNTYTDSGASQAQIVLIPQLTTFEVQGGFTYQPYSWDGNKGGILPIFAKISASGAGTISLAGRGFRGGANQSGAAGVQGEGTAAAGSASTSANGNGGGGGGFQNDRAGSGGGGGGNGAAGSNGGVGSNMGGGAGTGGSLVGHAELTTANLGGGGGGGGTRNGHGANSNFNGANGGGFLFLASPEISPITINLNGNSRTTASDNNHGAGGGGAGGSALLKGINVDVGTSKITANAGTGGNGFGSGGGDGGRGGNGAVGRIHADYSGSITGTTNPTINTRFDPTIKAGGSLGNFFAVF